MSGSRIVLGAIAGLLLVAAGVITLAVTETGSPHTPGTSPAGHGPGYGMMGPGYGMMGGGYGMMGGGYGPAGAAPRGSQTVTLTVKSDSEHGKRGPDGNWHDAFLPAGFTVVAGRTTTVTVYNYDDMPHSFTSPALGANQTLPAGSARSPSKTTFTFTAPSATGSYPWWCALPCDPWAMAHNGYMRGYITVSG